MRKVIVLLLLILAPMIYAQAPSLVGRWESEKFLFRLAGFSLTFYSDDSYHITMGGREVWGSWSRVGDFTGIVMLLPSKDGKHGSSMLPFDFLDDSNMILTAEGFDIKLKRIVKTNKENKQETLRGRGGK